LRFARQIDGIVYRPTAVGGTKVTPNEFPHMSAIGVKESSSIIWICGGSLISENFVLSAAHCTIFRGVQPSVIRIGDRDLKRTDDGAQPQEFDINRIIVHPSYSSNFKYHDLALFELNKDAMYDYK
jgi:secreted trypsin-like serine protease